MNEFANFTSIKVPKSHTWSQKKRRKGEFVDLTVWNFSNDMIYEWIEIIVNGKEKYIHQLHNQNRKQPTDWYTYIYWYLCSWMPYTKRVAICNVQRFQQELTCSAVNDYNVECCNCWLIIWLKIKMKNLHPISMIATILLLIT